MKKNLFIVGDVHGCFRTFKKLLNDHWNPHSDILLQVGDLIDRGTNSRSTIELCYSISRKYPLSSVFIKGNHEYELENFFFGSTKFKWFDHCGCQTLKEYRSSKTLLFNHLKWLRMLPTYWENDFVFVSHAGISNHIIDKFDQENINGLLWNRKPLCKLKKYQVIGHCVQKDIDNLYDQRTLSWKIDTGCCYGLFLTGLKLSWQGTFISINTLPAIKGDWQISI